MNSHDVTMEDGSYAVDSAAFRATANASERIYAMLQKTGFLGVELQDIQQLHDIAELISLYRRVVLDSIGVIEAALEKLTPDEQDQIALDIGIENIVLEGDDGLGLIAGIRG